MRELIDSGQSTAYALQLAYNSCSLRLLRANESRGFASASWVAYATGKPGHGSTDDVSESNTTVGQKDKPD